MNKNLHSAKRAKNDEFYTQLSDIEKELSHYREYFKDKTVLCNCDDPYISGFFEYFSLNFEALQLKKLITTCYKNNTPYLFTQQDQEQAVYLEYTGDKNDNRVPDVHEIGVKAFKGDGDFRSAECIELLKEADVVVTNPPFSLFREYLAQLIEYDKKFLIIGHQNAITYKEVFHLIKENKMWLGVHNNQSFVFGTPYKNILEANRSFCKQKGFDGETYVKVPGINWFTNIPHNKRNESLRLFKEYKGHEDEYPKYDNYDAIEVSKVVDIPIDYDGVMGVPITFLDKYNPEQFEIVGLTHRNDPYNMKTKIYTKKDADNFNDLNGSPIIKNGDKFKFIYMRILIKKR